MYNGFTLYSSDSRECAWNILYPRKICVSCSEELSEAVKSDHVAAEYVNYSRSKNGFIQSDCLMLDLDNTHSEDPSEWKSIEDIEKAFPGVAFYAVESLNHMKEKNGNAARPKYHLYFPINAVKDANQYKHLKDLACSMFPFFDHGAADAARFFYGVSDPRIQRIGGARKIDEYLILFATPQATHTGETNNSTKNKVEFGLDIDVGRRNTELYRYAYRAYMFGASPEETLILTRAYNERISDPLGDDEIVQIVNSACSKKGDRLKHIRKAEMAIEFSEAKLKKKRSSSLVCLADMEESEPEWLIQGYVPKGKVTVLAGDGGVGKTFVWCAIAAAVSSGTAPFVLNNTFSDKIICEPQKVMYFSSEDSSEIVLRPRLRQSGANLKNLITIDSTNEDFQDIKLDSSYLEELIKEQRPALVVFDPLQSFISSKTDMSARNQMREAMAKLPVYGEKYGTTFLVVMHTNKQQSVWGRTRLADSADIWDSSRSVLICGEADSSSNLKYLSHEKCNYGRKAQTVLFRVEDGTAQFVGYTDKSDRDYVKAGALEKTAPEREAAETFIIDFLRERGECEMGELDDAAAGNLISSSTLRRAKERLKKDGKIILRREGKGVGKGNVWIVSLSAQYK